MADNKEMQTQSPQSFKDKIWTPILAPVVALMAICLVTSFLLGITNNATSPIIAANTAAAADAARMELLPDADGFEELPVGDVANVSSIYKASNGVGYVIEAYGSGYGGSVPVMVAFGEDGNIRAIKCLTNDETPGLGKNLETDAAFGGQFSGLPAEEISYDNVDGIASATISSKAAVSAINSAVERYNAETQGGA